MRIAKKVVIKVKNKTLDLADKAFIIAGVVKDKAIEGFNEAKSRLAERKEQEKLQNEAQVVEEVQGIEQQEQPNQYPQD